MIEGILSKRCIGIIIFRSIVSLLCHHLTGISITSSINKLSQIGLVTITEDRFDTIMSSLSAFNQKLDGTGGISLVSKRDKAQILSECVPH